jgi:hypothetical protein
MRVANLNRLDYLVGCDESFIVIDKSGEFTFEAVNISTGEEVTIEGDYLDKGDISHYDFTNKGNAEIFILSSKMTDSRKVKLIQIIREIRNYYYN